MLDLILIFLSRADMKQTMRWSDAEAEAKAEQVLMGADVNGDGKINFYEWGIKAAKGY